MNTTRWVSSSACWLAGVALLLGGTAAPAADSTAAAPTTAAPAAAAMPSDHRLAPLIDLNGYFPFKPCRTKAQWQQRAERLRRQLLVATGLWPMPAATPAHPVIHGRIDRPDYTVEKVYFESFPGFFVTGNLYRPKGRSGKLPGVLCPHGHWPDGRFYDNQKKIVDEIVGGAERFLDGGRSPLQSRCVTLARMGCVVFHYDMVGYADSVQLVHRAGSREALNTRENWGFYSPQAELRLQTVMGLQTYDSIRALDWLCSLPDVDPQRIAVTGASGGGTQTFILCAIDPRPAVAFPAVMVSTAMQGGCTCENASYLRVGTGNVEIAALIAPRPLGMTAADDWTKELATKGLPELKQHYKMLGVPNNVMAKPLVQFPHNYNYVSREVMYQFMNKYLKLGLPEPVVEEDYPRLSAAEMTVWDDAHPKPPSGDDFERSLVRWMTADSQKQMEALAPADAEGLKKFRRIVGGAWDVLIGRGVPKPGDVRMQREFGHADFTFALQTIWNATELEHISAMRTDPATQMGREAREGQVVIWVSRDGAMISALSRGTGRVAQPPELSMAPKVSTLLALDLFGQGDGPGNKPLTKNRLNASGRDKWKTYAGYTYGYNYPLFCQRVHDILTAVGYARDCLKAKKIYVVGLRGAGPWVAAARAQAGALIDRAVIDTAGFRFGNLAEIDDADFVPGAAKYLDLPGLLALSAPYETWLSGEGSTAPAVVAAAYHAAGQPAALTVYSGPDDKKEAAALEWLLK